MVLIPGGVFKMGSVNGGLDERPVHSVTVADFLMDKTEVTVAAYEACVSFESCKAAETDTGCNSGRPDRANHPINCVDWKQASDFCGWAEKRLPTEEEWEYAARGAKGWKYPWGNAEPSNQLCWGREVGDKGTCPVGAFSRSDTPTGLSDMAGNVWEWTSSAYSDDYSRPRRAERFVVRGGTWFNVDPSFIRAAYRFAYAPTVSSYFLGFRCARSP
jgi:formylglycine-generating enzyme required for sulfatase activity